MWELPEPDHLINASLGELLGSFKHSITNHEYTFRVVRAEVSELPEDAPCRWVSMEELKTLPLSTTTRKAFKLPLFQIENLER
jgi:adenine-specific DNA glycosylase